MSRSSAFATLASISRLHIIAIAAAGTLTFGWLFTGHRPWTLALVVALDWFVVNLLNRVVDLEEDETNAIVGTAFVARHRRAVLVVGIASLVASLPAVHLVLPAITPWRLAYHTLGVAYNWPLIPFIGRIKSLYFWKNTASAVGFLITLFAYPLVTAAHGGVALVEGMTPLTIGLTAAYFMTFELSYEVIYDLRDVDGDRQAGVRSYAAVHGPKTAARIAYGLMLTSMITLAVGYGAGLLPWRVFVMIVAPALQWVLARRLLRVGLTSAHCVGLTWLGAAMLAAYNVWIALGLPGVGV